MLCLYLQLYDKVSSRPAQACQPSSNTASTSHSILDEYLQTATDDDVSEELQTLLAQPHISVSNNFILKFISTNFVIKNESVILFKFQLQGTQAYISASN